MYFCVTWWYVGLGEWRWGSFEALVGIGGHLTGGGRTKVYVCLVVNELLLLFRFEFLGIGIADYERFGYYSAASWYLEWFWVFVTDIMSQVSGNVLLISKNLVYVILLKIQYDNNWENHLIYAHLITLPIILIYIYAQI